MTQADAILAHLQTGQTITPFTAFELYGCLALHSRCAELRKRGHNIDCRIVSNGDKRWGEYRLLPAHQAAA